MSTGILHLHLLLGLMFLAALWKGTGIWARIAATLGALLVLSGIYNLMTRFAGAPAGWHIAIGLKVLAGLHAVTMAFLMARGGDPIKMARWRKSALGSAGFAALIGLYYSNFARG